MTEVFTTLLVQDGQPVWLKEHLTRLHQHARALGFCIPDKLNLNLASGTYLLRIAIDSAGYQISSRPLIATPASAYIEGVSVYISDQIASTNLKTNNRQVYNLAYQQALKHGAFEGLLCDSQGYLVDGSRTSLWVIQDKTITLLKGGIEGITRQQFALQAQKLGYQTQEAYLKPDAIKGELWLAGTSVGLLRVNKILCSLSDTPIRR